MRTMCSYLHLFKITSRLIKADTFSIHHLAQRLKLVNTYGLFSGKRLPSLIEVTLTTLIDLFIQLLNIGIVDQCHDLEISEVLLNTFIGIGM